MDAVAAIIVAAGRSERCGGNEKKIVAKVDVQPRVRRSVVVVHFDQK